MGELNQQQPGAEVAQPGEPVGATAQASSEPTTEPSSGADATSGDAGQPDSSSGSTGESQTDGGGDLITDKPCLELARGGVSVGDIFSVVVRDQHVTVIGRDGYVIIKDNEVAANVA